MKITKFIVSIVLFLGITVLAIWAVIKSEDQTCNEVSVFIHSANKCVLLSDSDVLTILKKNNVECMGEVIKDIDPTNIHNILAQENYIKSVDKVHIIGTKLQIEVTLYNILLEVNCKTGEKFLLDENGVYLPYSPKVENDVIVTKGNIPYSFHKKEIVSPDDPELYEIFSVASLIKKDPFYSKRFHNLEMNEKQEIVLHPSVGNLYVMFGTLQDAQNKLKTLKYMYEEVLPYMNDDKYAQLDVRFKNRIVATKKS